MSKGRKWRDQKGQRGGEMFSPSFVSLGLFQLADLKELFTWIKALSAVGLYGKRNHLKISTAIL